MKKNKGRHSMPRKLALLALTLTLAACGQTTPPDPNPTPHDMSSGPGLFSGDSGNILDAFKRGNGGLLGGRDATTNSMTGVNIHLWRAALDVVSVLPIMQTDSAGGVILTDWKNIPNTAPQQRLKVNVALLAQTLTPSAINVKVFKQTQGYNGWEDNGQDPAAARQLEDAILTKARVLSLQ